MDHPAPSNSIQAPRRILFVDDEPRILDGITRMLRPQRAELAVITAGSGLQALALLEQESVDVVVSDMRMPGMDGAELLTQIRQHHPRIVRMILSGQSDPATIIRATRAAHQFLSKPCEPDELRCMVLRSCQLRDLLADGGLAARITALEGLPSGPGALAALQAELDGPADPGRIASLVEADPGLSAKIIQVTASSFFGAMRGIATPGNAARRLGADILRSMVQAGALPAPSDVEIDWARWKATARRTATLARRFALDFDPALADAAETAGLLHDCATAVLSMTSSGAFRSLGMQAARQHSDVSAFMLGLWGFPDAIVEAVARHRYPSLQVGPHDRLCGVVHAAFCLSVGRGSSLDLTFLGSVGLEQRLAVWRPMADAKGQQ